jgi:predicted nucleic acid-binding protein
MLRIYLDNCCYNRPFDDPTIGNNFAEANAKIYIQSLVTLRKLSLVYSTINLKEIKASKNEENKRHILEFIKNNAEYYVRTRIHPELIPITDEIRETGIKLNDASHVACAVFSKCDYFLTTDKRLLNYKDPRIALLNPIDFEKVWREQYE